MEQFQHDFIEFAIKQDVLAFGTFTLKSGRISPYFFNAGQFNSSQALAKLGKFYAKAIMHANVEYDILFGPAYKGIPIVVSTAIELYEKYQLDKPFCFNRKEEKEYGEGGALVGAPLKGRVLLIDDVISAGTTFKESVSFIANYPAHVVGVITAMDREERGESRLSAIHEIEKNYKVTSVSIIKLQDVIHYLSLQDNTKDKLEAMLTYQEKYGVK